MIFDNIWNFFEFIDIEHWRTVFYMSYGHGGGNHFTAIKAIVL